MAKIKIGEWFRQLWLDPQKRHALAGEYLALRQSQLFLADLALRGRVWSDLVVPGDRDATMVNLGRRELALEVIELAEIEPQRLFQLIERAPLKESKVA